MIEALKVFALVVGECTDGFLSLFWWWGPLVGAALLVRVWFVLRPHGRHRAPRPTGGVDTDTVRFAAVPRPAEKTDS